MDDGMKCFGWISVNVSIPVSRVDGSHENYYFWLYAKLFLPVVLYGCETWSLTLREEHRLRVFENRVLRRIFGPKRVGLTGEWRKLHNEELNDLYSSPNIVWVIKSRRVKWVDETRREKLAGRRWFSMFWVRFPHQNLVHTSAFLNTCHMLCPSHSSQFYYSHNIG